MARHNEKIMISGRDAYMYIVNQPLDFPMICYSKNFAENDGEKEDKVLLFFPVLMLTYPQAINQSPGLYVIHITINLVWHSR